VKAMLERSRCRMKNDSLKISRHAREAREEDDQRWRPALGSWYLPEDGDM
jgi:hypothetical protein